MIPQNVVAEEVVTTVQMSRLDALRHHRSADRANLVVPRTKTMCHGDRSFAVFGPRLWNTLPAELKTPDISLLDFKRGLKTMLLNFELFCTGAVVMVSP